MHALRRPLQERFGNGGPGFVQLGVEPYRHALVKEGREGKWRSGGNGGGSCVATGDACSVNGDCCAFASGSALCVDFGSVDACAATCTKGTDCQSGCCATLTEGGGACAPAEFCQ